MTAMLPMPSEDRRWEIVPAEEVVQEEYEAIPGSDAGRAGEHRVRLRRRRSTVRLSASVTMPSVCSLGSEVTLDVDVAAYRDPGSRRGMLAPEPSHEVEAALLLEDAIFTALDQGPDSDGEVERVLRIAPSERHARTHFALRATEIGSTTCTVLFYTDSRYAGHVSVFTRVEPTVADDGPPSSSQHLDVTPPSSESAQASPPDLTIEIRRRFVNGRYKLAFRAKLGDEPTLRLGSTYLDSAPAAFMSDWYRELDLAAGNVAYPQPGFMTQALQFATGTRPAPKQADPALEDRIKARGDVLWLTLAPPRFHDFYVRRVLPKRVDTVQLVSNDPWIPWELMRLPTFHRGVKVVGDDGGKFLCERYALARWLSAMRPPESVAAPYELPWGSLAGLITRTPLSGKEQEWKKIVSLPRVTPVRHPLTYESFKAVLADADTDGVHIIAHGYQDPARNHRIQLVLDDIPVIPEDLSPQMYQLPQRPLAMLNSCYIGQPEVGLTGVGGWATAWVRLGCGAFIAPMWQAHSGLASEFAGHFYENLAAGMSVGSAVRSARLVIRRPDNPTWLSYTVYAMSSAHVAR